VQQVAWAIVTSGALETAVAVGVGLAPGPASPPRVRTANPTSAKTSADAKSPPCALRSALVYRIAVIILASRWTTFAPSRLSAGRS
jgi:hypothetical protein